MDEYLTVKDVQQILRLGRKKTYELVNESDFPCISAGG